MLSRNGQNNSNGSFDWKDAILDAAIISMLTFFTSLGGTALFTGNPWVSLGAAAMAAAGEFFLFMAIKRGLREKKDQEKPQNGPST